MLNVGHFNLYNQYFKSLERGVIWTRMVEASSCKGNDLQQRVLINMSYTLNKLQLSYCNYRLVRYVFNIRSTLGSLCGLDFGTHKKHMKRPSILQY